MSVNDWWQDTEQLGHFEQRLTAIRIGRRQMLRLAAAAGGVAVSVVAAACGQPTAPAKPADAPAKPAEPAAKPTEAAKPAAAGTAAPAAAAPAATTAPAPAAAAKPAEAAKPAAAGQRFAGGPGVFRINQEKEPLHFDYNL